MGHGGDGKTSLVESLLNIAGVTDRVGKIADGNTVCDFDPEEIKRKFSISTAVAPVEWNGCKINLLDTPGFFDFESEVQCALRVAESALIVATGKSGPGVGTEKAWAHCEEHAMPRMFYISKIDEENSDYYTSLHKLQKQFGVSVAPIVVPIFEGNRDTVGIVDCVIRKAYRMDGNKRVEIPIPEDMKDRIDQHRAALCENIAELSEGLMERYFAGEEFSDEELIAGIRQGVKDLVLAPVFCGTAATGIGSYALLKGIALFILYFLMGLVILVVVLMLAFRWRIYKVRKQMEQQFGEGFDPRNFGGQGFGSPFAGESRKGREGEVKVRKTSGAPEKRVSKDVGDYVEFEETKEPKQE